MTWSPAGFYCEDRATQRYSTPTEAENMRMFVPIKNDYVGAYSCARDPAPKPRTPYSSPESLHLPNLEPIHVSPPPSPPPMSVDSGYIVTTPRPRQASSDDSYTIGRSAEIPASEECIDDTFDAASFRKYRLGSCSEMNKEFDSKGGRYLIADPFQYHTASETFQKSSPSTQVDDSDAKAINECSIRTPFRSQLSSKENAKLAGSYTDKPVSGTGRGYAGSDAQINVSSDKAYWECVRNRAKLGWDQKSAIDPGGAVYDVRNSRDYFRIDKPVYVSGDDATGLGFGGGFRDPNHSEPTSGSLQSCKCNQPELVGSHGDMRCQYIESTNRDSTDDGQSLHEHEHSTIGDSDRDNASCDVNSGEIPSFRSAKSTHWYGRKKSASCACDSGNCAFNHVSPSWSYVSDPEFEVASASSQRSESDLSEVHSKFGRVATEEFNERGSQSQALREMTSSNGKTNDLTNEVDFLRQCLTNGLISQDDRYKAFGILSLFQGGKVGPSSVSKGPPDDPGLAVNPAPNDINAAFAQHRLESTTQEMEKQLTKMNAHNKFKRQQETDERLTRIEAKLAAFRANQTFRGWDLEKLDTRTKDRKIHHSEISNVDTRQDAIEDKLNDLMNALSKPKSDVNSNPGSKKSNLGIEEAFVKLNMRAASEANSNAQWNHRSVTDTRSRSGEGRYSTGTRASRPGVRSDDWLNFDRHIRSSDASKSRPMVHGLGIHIDSEAGSPRSSHENSYEDTWGSSSVIETPPESSESSSDGGKMSSESGRWTRGSPGVHGRWGARSGNSCACNDFSECYFHRNAGATPAGRSVTHADWCGNIGFYCIFGRTGQCGHHRRQERMHAWRHTARLSNYGFGNLDQSRSRAGNWD